MEKPRYYVLVADLATWEVSLDKHIWGFSESTKGLWNTSDRGHYVAFYVTAPWKKIIGFGTFGSKFVDDRIIWPDEKFFHKAIWKYRIKINVKFAIEDWKKGIPVSPDIMLNTGRKVVPRQLYFSLVKSAEKEWGTSLRSMVSS